MKYVYIFLFFIFILAAQASAARQTGNFIELWGNNGTTEVNAGNPFPVITTGYGQASPLGVEIVTSGKATYYATTGYFIPAATPTDIVGILGSNTTTLKIQRISISSFQTVAGINKWFLIKRSTADTGGTPTALALVSADSNNVAATGVINQYTANPTLGTAVGTIKATSILSPAPGSVMLADNVIYDAMYTGQPIVLRGAAQGLYLNFAGAAVPGGFEMAVTVIYTEE